MGGEGEGRIPRTCGECRVSLGTGVPGLRGMRYAWWVSGFDSDDLDFEVSEEADECGDGVGDIALGE